MGIHTQVQAAAISSAGPRQDIDVGTVEQNSPSPLEAAVTRALPEILNGLRGPQLQRAHEHVMTCVERALGTNSSVQPDEIPALVRSFAAYIKGLHTENLCPQQVYLQGFQIATISAQTEGGYKVSLPLGGSVELRERDRVVPEHSSDGLIFRANEKPKWLLPGQMVILDIKQSADMPGSHWCSAAEYNRPRMPAFATAQEFAAEFQFLFPNSMLELGGDLTKPLPTDSMAFRADMDNALSAALESIAVSADKSGPLAWVRRDFEVSFAHLKNVLAARNTFFSLRPGADPGPIQGRADEAHDYVRAHCRSMYSSVASHAVFDLGEIREIVRAFDHLERAGHALLRSIGVAGQ